MFVVILASIGIIFLALLIIGKYNEKHVVVEGFGFANLTNCSNTPWTIDKPTKLIITDIIRNIINNINEQIGMSYYFTAFDQLKHDIISREETRFTADIFVHEVKYLFTRRMILVFTVNFATKNVHLEYINQSNAFKVPNKVFMDYPAPELILQDDNLLSNKYHIMGRNNSKLDFSILKDYEILKKDVPTPTEFQNWILPIGISAAYHNPQAMFPSRQQYSFWDTNGINYTDAQTQHKIGINNTIQSRVPYPYFNPTANLQQTYNSNTNWLFSIADNHSGGNRSVAM